MKIRLDDTGNTLEINDGYGWHDAITMYGDNSGFESMVQEILTESQYDKYVQCDTIRTFTLSNKKQSVLNKYLNSKPF